MKTFLVGLGIGAVVGLSLAPEEGRATRKKLAQRGNDLLKRAESLVGGSSMAPQTGRESGQPKKEQRQAEQPRKEQRQAEQPRREQQQPEQQQAPAPEQHEGADAVVQVLNTARKSELTSVQGIGDATAKRIIKNRPFESEEEVLEKKVVPENVLENVKEKLVGSSEEEVA